MKKTGLFLAAGILAGCATPPDWVKEGASPDDYTRQTAACRVTARGVAAGPAAAAPNGLTPPQQAQFSDCMLAAGWKPGR
ncbi:MAG: hypothetical protein JO256_09440 [Alphaproteobacteria bacterium]|nr:hypothetical protein [Alphaproteobacteria bacterium]